MLQETLRISNGIQEDAGISWHVMWLMTNRMTNTWLAVEQLLSNIPVQLNVVLVVSFWKNPVFTWIMHFH